MKFLIAIYTDDALLDAMPEDEFNTLMRGCLEHADGLKQDGRLIDTQQLEGPEQARTLRTRNQRTTVIDGPFAEAKEHLGGFILIEAADMDEAQHIASALPWSATGRIEIRPVRDMEMVRRRVGAASAERV